MSNFIKTKLKITGMNCASCAMKIDFDLEDIPGVKNAKTSFAKQLTEVEFDDQKTNVESLLAQVAKTGYTATVKPE